MYKRMCQRFDSVLCYTIFK